MNFSYTRFQSRKFRDETTDGDEGAGAGAGTEGQANATSVLTDDGNSDAGDEGNTDSPTDDGTGNTDGDQDTGKTGTEGSDDVPETYADFSLPEGMEVDAVALEAATPIFKELGLNQEQAQKLVDFYANKIQAGSQQQIDDFNQLMNDWVTQAKSDSEIGGDKFDENIKIAQSAIAKYGTPELKQLLVDHGVGNHPEMIRFMVKVGRTLKEDVPGDIGDQTSKPQDRVSMMYGNQSE